MNSPPIPVSFWNQYPTVLRPTRPPTFLGGAGGLSGSDLWKVESACGPLMVRAWPTNGPDQKTLDQIHGWLIQARRLKVVAIPRVNRGGATWVEVEGRFWEVAPFLPGAADLGRPPTSTHLASMFQALAAFHQGLAKRTFQGPSRGLVARGKEVNRLILTEFAALRSALERAVNDPHESLASEWLARARQIAPNLVAPLGQASLRVLDLQPCIRDVRPDHFLFEADKLTGLVDFGAMGIDSVATDLARLLGETVGRSEEPRLIALDAYETIRPITPVDLTVLDIFEAANALLGGARWVRWHFVENRRFENPDAVASGLGRSLWRLEDYWGKADGLMSEIRTRR